MRNPLQEQLFKAGLVKKQKVDDAARALARQRDGKAAPPPRSEQVNAQQLQAERAERDRALAAEHNAQVRAKELAAQVRQLIENHKIDFAGEIEYRFVDEGKVRTLAVSASVRTQLAKGLLVIARNDQHYAVLPRASAELVRERGGLIVLDHAQAPSKPQTADDEYYQRFQVPDDLIW